MASTTRWIINTAWSLAFGTEIQSMVTANAVLSSVSITNATNLDMFMDISQKIAIASSTPAVGAAISYHLALLNQDGTTYGDGNVTTSKGATLPAISPCAAIPCSLAATQIVLAGVAQQIILPPGTFSLVMQNNSGITLGASNATVIYYRTYNINLNV